MYKRILSLICALMLMTAPSLAAANIDYTLFGDAFRQSAPAENQFFLTYDGERYSLLDDCARFDEALTVYGGKTRAVYEYTLPQGGFSVEDDGSELLLGRMTIDVPYRAQLTVLEGNRRSGEYTVVESRELTDVYVDQVLLPRGSDGAPALVDRIYLYTYEAAGEVRRMAATLYFDYEGFTAGYGTSETAPGMTETAPQTIETASGELAVQSPRSSGYLTLMPVLVCLAMLLLILRRRKSGTAPSEKPAPAAQEPSAAADDALASGHELLRKIQSESLRIGDGEISERADKIQAVCAQMLAAADEHPGKAPKLRRFLNYYLPTSLKLLACLRTVRQRGVSKAEVDKVRASALHGLDMVLTACQKQLDNLYRDEMLDVSADIDVLEQMLERDGFTESALDRVRSGLSKSDR